MGKQKVSVKMGLAYDEALDYMRALVNGLESGKIILTSGDEEIVLTPARQIGIKVEAKIKKDKQKFSFELSWADPAVVDLNICDNQDPSESVEPAGDKTDTDKPSDKAEKEKGKRDKASKQKSKKGGK